MAKAAFPGIQLQTPPAYKGTHKGTGIMSFLDGASGLGWLASRWCAAGSGQWLWHIHGYDLNTGEELYMLDAHEYAQWLHWHTPTQRLHVGFVVVNRVWEHLGTPQMGYIQNTFCNLLSASPWGTDSLLAIESTTKEHRDDPDAIAQYNLLKLQITQRWQCYFSISVLACHPTTRQIAVASRLDKKWRIGWGPTPDKIALFDAPGKGEITRLVWLSEDKLAVGRLSGILEVWDTALGQKEQTLVHKKGVNAILPTSDPTILYTSSNDHLIHQWNLKTGESMQTWAGHKDYVTALALSADGKKLYSGSCDRTIRYWDLD